MSRCGSGPIEQRLMQGNIGCEGQKDMARMGAIVNPKCKHIIQPDICFFEHTRVQQNVLEGILTRSVVITH